MLDETCTDLRALIVDEPWLGLILSGGKDWEMRPRPCLALGPIGLIRKGSGTVVATAVLERSLPPIEGEEAYAAAFDRHRIPPALQARAMASGWRFPWVLSGVATLPAPVPYAHRRGAVSWVRLAPDVVRSVLLQAPVVLAD